VRFDGGDAHVELAADLRVGFAEPDRDGDSVLAVGEALELIAGAAFALVDLAVGHVPDRPPGDRGGEGRLTGGDGPHGADDIGRRGVREEEPADGQGRRFGVPSPLVNPWVEA